MNRKLKKFNRHQMFLPTIAISDWLKSTRV